MELIDRYVNVKSRKNNDVRDKNYSGHEMHLAALSNMFQVPIFITWQ